MRRRPHSEAAGRAWITAELQRVAQERGRTVTVVAWTCDFERDTHYVHFSFGGVKFTAPIAAEDLEDAANDLSVQTWLAAHLRRTSA